VAQQKAGWVSSHGSVALCFADAGEIFWSVWRVYSDGF
jgi:hypothetical protein